LQELLFYENGDLSSFLDHRKNSIKTEIEAYDSNEFLNLSEEDLYQYLISKYKLKSPGIIDDQIHISDTHEVDIDVSQDQMRAIFDRSKPVYIKGVSITISIPFDGNGELFNYKPSRFDFNPPRGIIKDNELLMIYETLEQDVEKIKKAYEHDINSVKKYLGYTNQQINNYNQELDGFLRDIIKKRKKKLLDDLGLISSLGIPIKKSSDIPKTFTVKTIRQIPSLERPRASTENFKPEPVFPEEEYEYILRTINNMTLVMERSPKTFSNMKENEIRDHFLLILNSHYEGSATGETFNYSGKTDILIRYNGKNVFIAECKFWSGEKGLTDTINQLISYTSWRDTKTAILLFNKEIKDFSIILNKIDETVKSHDCYKRDYILKDDNLKTETIFSYVFHQPVDTNKELYLTIMAFNIPQLN